jgi:hypothetical protein
MIMTRIRISSSARHWASDSSILSRIIKKRNNKSVPEKRIRNIFCDSFPKWGNKDFAQYKEVLSKAHISYFTLGSQRIRRELIND